MKPAPPLSDAAHAAIALELVRLCLCGKPERPELVSPLLDYSNGRKPTDRRQKRVRR